MRIRCKCGEYLLYTEHRGNIKEVQIHHCPLTKLFQDCNYKGTFANCNPSACSKYHEDTNAGFLMEKEENNAVANGK